MSAVKFKVRRPISLGMALLLAATMAWPEAGVAQNARGLAAEIDIPGAARRLDTQDRYARALYSWIRANPGVWADQQFYLNLIVYLMSTTPDFDCNQAFASEFERNDFFQSSYAWGEEIRDAILTVKIPDRADVAFRIDTGEYDFNTQTLPFDQVTSVNSSDMLGGSVQAGNGQNCATQIFRNTGVQVDVFPWRFDVVNEAGDRANPGFPFSQSLQLSPDDARVLFERFGRELYAIVGYRVEAANDGQRLVQVVPTDGQLFGLASDAVVRVESFAHPTLSQPTQMDISTPLSVAIPQLETELDLTFRQEGFRAVGSGVRQDRGTAMTTGRRYPIDASAAVGSSVFVIRLDTENMSIPQYGKTDPGPVSVTLFGSVNFSAVTANEAPVSGSAVITFPGREDYQGRSNPSVPFTGAFRPASDGDEPETASEAAESKLDMSPVGTEAGGAD